MVGSYLYSVASLWEEASDSDYIVDVNIPYRNTTQISRVRAGTIYHSISCDLNIPVYTINTPPGHGDRSGGDDSGYKRCNSTRGCCRKCVCVCVYVCVC